MYGLVGGLVISVLTSLLLVPDSVNHLNMINIQRAIDKCPNKEYIDITVKASTKSSSVIGKHGKTTITCKDGSTVTVSIK